MDRRDFLRCGGIAAVGLGLAPLASFVPGSPLVSTAWARGAGKQEAERAQSIVQRVEGGGGSAQRKTLGPGQACVVEPGGLLHFAVDGYCLDPHLSTPSANEPLAFRPMTAYIAPDLRELYVRVLHNALTGKGRSADIQKIVWAMRAPAASEWTQGFTADDRAYLEGLMAGGVHILQTAHRPDAYIAGSGGSSGGAGNGGRGGGSGGAGAILGFLLPAITGQLPYDIRSHSNGLLRQLQNRRAERAMPSPLYSYSMLSESGVAGRGMGVQGLSVRGTIANGSAQSFSFDPVHWVMESSRDVQAVALPSLNSVSVSKGEPLPPESAAGNTAPEQGGPEKTQPATPPDRGLGRSDGFQEFATEPDKE